MTVRAAPAGSSASPRTRLRPAAVSRGNDDLLHDLLGRAPAGVAVGRDRGEDTARDGAQVVQVEHGAAGREAVETALQGLGDPRVALPCHGLLPRLRRERRRPPAGGDDDGEMRGGTGGRSRVPGLAAAGAPAAGQHRPGETATARARRPRR